MFDINPPDSIEGFEFIEGAYENIIGMSREEQIADGKNPLSVNFDICVSVVIY